MLLLHAASICREVQSKCRHSFSHFLRLFKKSAQQARKNGCDSSAAPFPPPTANMERKSQGYRMEGEKKTLEKKKKNRRREKQKNTQKGIFGN